MKQFVQPLLLAVLCGLRSHGSAIAAERPNVIVILTDDQGWGDVSFSGNTNLSTPHVDSLARDGASFNRFYVCPVCSPTRAEFLTGRYHSRTGVHGVSEGGERLNLDETTIADTFKAAGYATANFGKWHNGTQGPYHPNARGFDEYYGFTSGHWGDYFSPPLDHNGQIVRGDGFTTDDFTNKAMAFIEYAVRDTANPEPFFVYLTYNTPHAPMQVPDRWWNKFKDKELELRGTEPDRENVAHTRAALAMCENIDWNVGRLLERLDDLGIAENTIVAYFCDNGPNGDRWNGGLKGIKGSTDEGGVRSPLLMRWPKHIAAGKRIEPIAGAIDLLPTLTELANIPLVGKKPIDGRSLKPLLIKSPANDASLNAALAEFQNRAIISHWGNRTSASMGRFHLDPKGRLYDVIDDPGQQQDVATQHPRIKRQLVDAVKAWKLDVLANYSHDYRPFPVGHPVSPITQLPARDAKSHGEITRSSRHPNCSYFTNWNSTDDRITWDANVLSDGTYDVQIYYTCPTKDVGAAIELSFRDSKLNGTITEPHDSPLIGREHDRVPRTESYVKDFRPLELGTIELKKGRGELTLRALKVPGSQVMDFRLLVLTRSDK